VVASGTLTFGSFNHSSKISEATLALWARALEAVPNSRLFLKARAFAETETCERLRGIFAARGIAGDRLEFSGLMGDPKDHLAAYARVDIALDTFPYHGTTTTCEALWMGVPVLSLVGGVHAARVGKSILGAVGLGACACDSEEAFVNRALALAADLPALADLRAGLRQAVIQSALCDRKRFVPALEQAYRRMLLPEGA
jgi:predicted O-linked N-acetylglucosamine transferase (SPINDLY family)